MSHLKVRSRVVGAVVVVIAVGLTTMSTVGTANAIAGGTPVPDGQYTFSTKLTMTNIPRSDGSTYDSACSGALIAPQWIISSGHCFHDVNGNRVSGPTPYPTTATVGRAGLSGTGGYLVNITEIRQAPRVDVALAKLETAIDITPLPLSPAAPKTGAILQVTGYGATSSVNPVPASRLQTGQVKVKRVTGTSLLVVGYLPFTTTSACIYDSGEPYFLEQPNGSFALVSIETDGPPCPHSREETTTRIDRIIDWIHQSINT